MLRAIVSFCLRFRGVVIALAAIVLIQGVEAARHSKLDVFPEFVPPQVVVQTEAPGFAAEQIETLVTTPVEAAIGGLGGLRALRSASIQGLSVVTVVFEQGTDIFRARQLLAEKLAGASARLPQGAHPPTMSAPTSSTMDLLKIGLVSDRLSPMALRSLADWTVRPRLLAVPGVAQVTVFGGEVRQLQIQLNPDRLLAHGLGVADVLAAARASTGVVGAGFIDTPNQRIVLETQGQAIEPEVLAQVEVARHGAAVVRLGDVARVVEAGAPKFGDALVQGRPGVLLTMLSQYGANTLEVTRAVERALGELRPVFDREGVTLYPGLHRPATFIETALHNLRSSLFLGALLVAVVIFAFLGHGRTALISLSAIPLSLLSAVIVLDWLGQTLNTMTLGGLAIAIGEVVDDAIIDVENIFRRLRENEQLGRPRRALAVVLEASLEVRRAIVFATLVVVTVFLPVLTLTGLQGSFFAPLSLAYIAAVLASLVVALTVTPALSLALLGPQVRTLGEPRLQRWVKARYRRQLSRVASHPRRVVAAVALLCTAALAALPFFGGEFLPDFREGHFVLEVSAAPGTSLDELRRIGTAISRALLELPAIATVEQQLGRAEQGEDTWGPHRSEFHVELKKESVGRQEGLADQIRSLLAGFPGIQSEVLTFLGDRIGETITGEVAPVVVNLFGDDLDALDATAREVARVLATIPGAADVVTRSPPGLPRTAIRLRPERLAHFGFRPTEVMEAVQTAYQGTVVAQTHRANQTSDVVVILDEASRQDPESVGSLILRNGEGQRVPLRVLADVSPSPGRYEILHEGARRRQTVTCSPTGRDVVSFVADAQRAIAEKVAMPPGVYAIFSGEAEARTQARNELLSHAAIALVGVVLLLAVGLRSWRNLVLVLANLPFALVGGVLAVAVTDFVDPAVGRISIGTLVGFVTLFGITTRNSLMMISHFDHLVNHEGVAWGPETALRGATERVIPILMTASVTGLGLAPLAFGSGQAGREIEGPMAIVILGGLVTSTALNLLVLPTLALRFGRFERRPEESESSGAA
ncbi:MAG TPA: efflux RND transporter permease subunit [Myxococcota bacterium]|nr:efflux RND transporter permease subunit [Myxococcota bacterium]